MRSKEETGTDYNDCVIYYSIILHHSMTECSIHIHITTLTKCIFHCQQLTMFHSGSKMILSSGFSIATGTDGSISFNMQEYTYTDIHKRPMYRERQVAP